MKRIVSITAFLFVMAAVVPAQDIPKVINGGVLNGKAVKLPKPEYSEEARAAKVEATVKVQVTIDENGDVIAAQAVSDTPVEESVSSKAALLDLLARAAEKAAMEARFTPTRLSGEPMKVTGVITYRFMTGKVDDEQETRPVRNDTGDIDQPPSAPVEAPRRVSGGVLNGKAVSLPRPAYPEAARAVKAQGTVSVQVLIGENGEVISAAAVSGHPLLRAAATEAARNAKFDATYISGQAVKVSGVITYNFVLPDAKSN